MKYLIAVTSVIIINLVGTIVFYSASINFSEKQTIHGKYDATVIFFHSMDDDYILSKETRFHLDRAIELYNNDLVNNIICSGGYTSKREYHGSIIMKRYLISNGIPEIVINSDTTSYDTFSNIRSSFELIDKNLWDRIILIGSPLHFLRLLYATRNYTHELLFYSDREKYFSANSIGFIWWAIQHEFTAWSFIILFPDELYKKIILKIRHNRFPK